ncbi:MAG: hypothetical protein FJ241_10440 [Nitrospira sp.]|nr:hypothetical protein [Nitrospira sp.]
MTKKIFIAFLLIAAMVFFPQSFVVKSVIAQEGAVLDVNEIIKNVDPAKFTKAQIKEYYKNVEKKQAKGEGIVVNVISGKGKHKVTILTPASNPEKGYNVVLYTTQNATELNMKDGITFEGEVGRLSTWKGASIDIHGSYRK